MKGTVTKKGTKWYIVVDVGFDERGKRKQKWFSGFKTKKEAEAKLVEILQQLNTGTYVDSKNMKVADYLEKWLQDYAKHKVAPKTYRSYHDTVHIHLNPKIGHYKLEKLSPTIIQSYYTWCIENTELSNTSINYNHKILKQALNQAVKWQLLIRNPCLAVEPPKKEKHKVEVLNEEEINKLLDACKDEVIYLPIFLAITTGMRRGEIAGLEWKNVDFKENMLYVEKALQRIDGELQLVAPKTQKSNRPVALFDSVVAALKNHKKQQRKNRKALGDDCIINDFVCTWEDGRIIDPDYISNAFNRLTKKLDIPKRRFHDLRHTHATLLLKEGVHPKVVSERLGHSQISITLDIYSHVIPSMQKDAVEKIKDKFAR
ncbi:MAG: site-specific integrase [Clostridiaceae bacterium]|nr:site-specific integrase [Clostridiaceae bacterium]